ncbi:phosphoglucosamine mutase [Methanobrevibacter curvatus]|uniref:Phosphoglucosamine mutase n=1 Tax=Methanobrevibacter curvatus TaxID=49547 RepID=A0A166CEX5_9EURY|nr:phosphoglucosamine mutase [Methanobrevibacter curvatus]KZX14429.1 phosphoglucosamine mutase [Methanobrevibacter curvatus]
MVKKRLFGTFGVRRIANEVLTPEFASRLAASYGTIVKGKIAIGGDTRTTTKMIKNAIAAGLLSAGCEVVDCGILPTPALQYAVRNYYNGGIMITASHNPPKYNGIKFLDDLGIGISDEMDLAVEEIYFDKEPDRVPWNQIPEIFTNDRIIDEYIDEVLKRVDVEAIKNAKFKVILDPGSGAGCFTSPYILEKLGVQLITLNAQADGFFPGRDPEPTEINLQTLIATVKELKADIGFAHDGDADRTICIDEKGNFVQGDKSFALIEKLMLKENGGGLIVTTVATSQAIEDIAVENNGEFLATAVGDLIVARKLHEDNGLFGGEENGGLIFPEFVYGRDAALSTAKILELMAKEKKPLSELVNELPIYYSQKMKIECDDAIKEEIMDKISEEVENLGFKIDRTDGVKIFKDEGWVIIRPSGTEPIFRSFSESKSETDAEDLANWGISLIKKYKESV